MSQQRDLVPFAPTSPSEYWTIRTWEFTAMARRRSGPNTGMRVVFEHIKENRDKVQVIVMVDRNQDLSTLIGFLDAARDLPAGFRLEAHVLESAPWDVIKPPSRWDMGLESG